MTSPVHIKARITPWDDPAFVKAFEHARDEVHGAQDEPDGTKAGALVQQLLHDASQELDARVVLNNWDERQLAQMFRRYGEDPNARRIARAQALQRAPHTRPPRRPRAP